LQIPPLGGVRGFALRLDRISPMSIEIEGLGGGFHGRGGVGKQRPKTNQRKGNEGGAHRFLMKERWNEANETRLSVEIKMWIRKRNLWVSQNVSMMGYVLHRWRRRQNVRACFSG